MYSEKYSVSWNECKSYINPLLDNIMYVNFPDRYEIFVVKDAIYFTCTIYKYYSQDDVPENLFGFDFDSNYNALVDFEANYKPYCRFDTFIYTKDARFAPVREYQLVGKKFTIYPPTPPDEVKQNIFDIRISEDMVGKDGCVEFIGGAYYIREADKITDDDFIEFSIVDKDDVLGLFNYYGLQKGTDVLELAKFIKTHAVIGGQRITFEAGQSKVIPLGLYLRVAYFSYGSSPFVMKTDFILPR